jgi:hypothetical protein
MGLSYSIIIRKYLDQRSGNVNAIQIDWTDCFGNHQHQAVSANDNTYLAQENAFL